MRKGVQLTHQDDVDDIALNVKLLIVTAKIGEAAMQWHSDIDFFETKCIHRPLATPVQKHSLIYQFTHHSY